MKAKWNHCLKSIWPHWLISPGSIQYRPESHQVHIAGPIVFQRKNIHTTAMHQHREAAGQGIKLACLLKAFTDKQNKLYSCFINCSCLLLNWWSINYYSKVLTRVELYMKNLQLKSVKVLVFHWWNNLLLFIRCLVYYLIKLIINFN